jgi:hypothetical protein
MAKLYIGYPTAENQRQENQRNAVLVDAADAAAAKAAAIAAKIDGSTNDSKVNAWTFAEIAGTAGSLPNGGTVLWLEGLSNYGAHRAL